MQINKYIRLPLSTGRVNIKQAGFTLLEVLVAIGVFSMVAMISYSTLDTYLDQRERLTVHYGKLERLQRLFILLERDIQFAVRRSVRDGGDRQPAMMSEKGDALITLTVAQADAQSEMGISLKRVEWRLEGEELIRAQGNVLDGSGNNESAELLVSDEVAGVEFNYLIYTPNRGVDLKPSLDDDEFPSGIELNIKMSTGEEYRRVFAIAQGA